MAKCNICGRKTWFFQSSQCECRAQYKNEKSRSQAATTRQVQRPTQSPDMTDLYLLQQQQNLINASFSDPEPCKSPSSSHDASPSYQHSSDSNSCNSSSSWDCGSDSSSSYSGD